LAKIRHVIDRDRLETLNLVAELINSRPLDELEALFKQCDLAEDLATKIAAMSRTSAESIDPDEEWGKSSSDKRAYQRWLRSMDQSADGFDLVAERFDRYYSRQLASRLEGIVHRGSALQPMNLEVKSQSVRNLFQEAHEVFLYGFDAAAIALCRSLVDQSLREKWETRSCTISQRFQTC
jgi:hypothetical protein